MNAFLWSKPNTDSKAAFLGFVVSKGMSNFKMDFNCGNYKKSHSALIGVHVQVAVKQQCPASALFLIFEELCESFIEEEMLRISKE